MLPREKPEDLKGVSPDLSFWQEKSLSDIHYILFRPLIVKGLRDELPENDDIKSLLKNVAIRLKELCTDEIEDERRLFELDAKYAHRTCGLGQTGEKELRLEAVVNYYLGRYQEAAEAAASLGDTYFINHHAETDFFASHFNLLAGQAFRKVGKHEQAAHHFNQYLEANSLKDHDDILDIVRYMIDQHLPIKDDGNIMRIMASMIERTNVDWIKKIIQDAPVGEVEQQLKEMWGFSSLEAYLEMSKKYNERFIQLNRAVVAHLLHEEVNHPTFRSLEKLIRDTSLVAPLNTGGVFAGQKPRSIRDLNQALARIHAGEVDIRDGIKVIIDVARRMGSNHPIYLAAQKCQGHVGNAKHEHTQWQERYEMPKHRV